MHSLKTPLCRFIGTLFLALCFSLPGPFCTAQIDTVTFEETGSIQFPPPGFLQFKSSFATVIDREGRPYLYSANKEYGLGIYEVSDSGAITSVLDLAISEFNGLDVSNIEQAGELLYVAIGDFQAVNPASGLAIVNVSVPSEPIVRDIWDSTTFVNGASHLCIAGDRAYVSMMNDGLLILDVSDPDDIRYLSHLTPDPDFPAPSAGHHQSRGLFYRNDTIYLCHDRGGLRVIDVSDPFAPREVYQYINTGLTGSAVAAYNDVLLKENFAFVSVDYCGLEILDISSTPFELVEWYNPWDCSVFNWNGAELHTNELATACHDSLLLVSGGNSELIAFDITDPRSVRRIGQWLRLDDSTAAWGLDVLDDRVALSMVDNPIDIPYVGNWGGIKMLKMGKDLVTANLEVPRNRSVKIYPNPFREHFRIECDGEIDFVELFDWNGRSIIYVSGFDAPELSVPLLDLQAGVYYLVIITNDGPVRKKVIKMK